MFTALTALILWSFIDINECTANATHCDVKATCTNTIGSFTCQCNLGYEGNGTHCVGK